MTCSHCVAAGQDVFRESVARRDLRRYRRKGPAGTTRLLLHGLRDQTDVEGSTVLDVGAGVGVIPQELLAAGARSAVAVDASPAYVEAARREAHRRETADRMEVVEGDFLDVAARLEPADIVTLDRAVCCYPHMRLLVGASAAKARGYLGLVLPREHALGRLGVRVLNLVQRLRRSAFRVYLHPPDEVEEELGRRGFRRTWQSRTWLWHVRIYRRGEPDAGASPGADARSSRKAARSGTTVMSGA